MTYSWRGRKKTVTVKVRDTKPPVLEMKNSYTVDLGGAVTADDFVKKVKDASEVSLKILNAKKWVKRENIPFLWRQKTSMVIRRQESQS